MSNELKDCVKGHSKARDPLDQLLLFYLADYTNNGMGYAYPTIERMVRETHITRRTLQRRIKGLETLGAMTVDRGGKGSRGREGRASRYYITCGSEGDMHGTHQRVTDGHARVTNSGQRVSPGEMEGDNPVRDLVSNTSTQKLTQAGQDSECPDCLNLRKQLMFAPSALCPTHFHEKRKAIEKMEGHLS